DVCSSDLATGRRGPAEEPPSRCAAADAVARHRLRAADPGRRPAMSTCRGTAGSRRVRGGSCGNSDFLFANFRFGSAPNTEPSAGFLAMSLILPEQRLPLAGNLVLDLQAWPFALRASAHRRSTSGNVLS